jgi:hypothetical protein
MDGRTQLPVNQWLRARCRAEFVDTVTEPGPVHLLVEGNAAMIESIRSRVEISVVRHGSRTVAVVAHHDCAGNPVPMDLQLVQLRKAVDVVGSWFDRLEVLGLWLGEDWQVTEEYSLRPGACDRSPEVSH